MKLARASSLFEGKSDKRHSKSKLADELLANQVIIRKESKSYRMSAIQNLQTFGKCFLFELLGDKVGEGRWLTHPSAFGSIYCDVVLTA